MHELQKSLIQFHCRGLKGRSRGNTAVCFAMLAVLKYSFNAFAKRESTRRLPHQACNYLLSKAAINRVMDIIAPEYSVRCLSHLIARHKHFGFWWGKKKSHPASD